MIVFVLRLQSVTERKKREKKEGEEATLAQVVGFNTLNNFCLCGFFFFFFTLARFLVTSFVCFRCRATPLSSELSTEETFSVVMTRQQQQQRDEGVMQTLL